jgi:hypothetical protein
MSLTPRPEDRALDPRLPQPGPHPGPAGTGAGLVSLGEIGAKVARLTPGTERLISRQMIARMKPTAYIINTARSGLVDEEAL